VEKEEALGTVKEERNVHPTIKRRKANWTGHTSLRNCPLKQVIEEKIEGRYELMGDEEEDVGGYWITLRKRDVIGN
jgi:hypothetical protein